MASKMYTVVGKDFSIGPLPMRTLIKRVRHVRLSSKDVVITHALFGDQRTPIADFPELFYASGTLVDRSVPVLSVRERFWLLIGLWFLAFLIAAPTAIPLVITSPMSIFLFPMGWLAFFKSSSSHTDGSLVDAIVFISWPVYLLLSTALLIISRRKIVVTIAIALGAGLILNAAGCSHYMKSFERFGH